MALQDQDPDFGLLDGDEANLAEFISPRSSSFRTARYPGFWSAGEPFLTTPNPVAGDDPVAKLSEGEIGNPINPPAPLEDSTSFQNIMPSGLTDGGGTSIDEREATTEQTVKSAGMVTDPEDFAKAINLGTSFLSQTGIASLAAGELLNAVGLNPMGSAFDIKSNINKRPGYSQAYDEALIDAKKRGLKGLGAANDALRNAGSATDPGSNSWGTGWGTEDRTAPTAAPAQDVTEANKVTGFVRSDAPAAPASTGAGSTSTTPGGVTTPVAKPGTVSAPAAPAPGQAGWSPSGGNNGVGSGGGGGGQQTTHDGMGGTSSTGAGGQFGHLAEGGVVQHEKPAISQIQHGDIGDDPMEEAEPTAQPAMPPAAAPMAEADPKYAPPPEAIDPQGVVDGEPAMLTPGELVIKRDSAVQYPPEIKQLMNEDPEVILAALEAFGIELDASGDDTDYEAMAGGEEGDDGVSDDNSGLGVAAPRGRMPAGPTDPRMRLSGATR
jgi:hypothetical protein